MLTVISEFPSLQRNMTNMNDHMAKLNNHARQINNHGMKFDPITEDMRDILHWLLVCQRIDFKLDVLVFKCLCGNAPSYLVESVSAVADQPNLQSHWSATRGDPVVPGTQTVKMGRVQCCGTRSHSNFVYTNSFWKTNKAKLKSHLFRSAYIS